MDSSAKIIVAATYDRKLNKSLFLDNRRAEFFLFSMKDQSILDKLFFEDLGKLKQIFSPFDFVMQAENRLN